MENIVWGTSDETAEPALFDDAPLASEPFDALFPPESAPASVGGGF
jgi:hypothetical protein